MTPACRRLEPPGRHDACFLPRSAHVTGDIDVHEMTWVGDALWFVNTRFSCLCTLDGVHSFVPRWRPPFVSALAPEDRCHLNGLWLSGDGGGAEARSPRGYATALGETDTPQGWRPRKRDGGVLLEVPSGEVVARGLSMPHSPRWYRDRLWVLESGTGGFGYVDDPGGTYHEVVAELPGFTRGLDFLGDFAFVGLSQVRESAVFGGIPVADRAIGRTRLRRLGRRPQRPDGPRRSCGSRTPCRRSSPSQVLRRPAVPRAVDRRPRAPGRRPSTSPPPPSTTSPPRSVTAADADPGDRPSPRRDHRHDRSRPRERRREPPMSRRPGRRTSGRSASLARDRQPSQAAAVGPSGRPLRGWKRRTLLSGATITVNNPTDVISPNLLSLRQAIELVDGTLPYSSLTAAQAGQVSGPTIGPDPVDHVRHVRSNTGRSPSAAPSCRRSRRRRDDRRPRVGRPGRQRRRCEPRPRRRRRVVVTVSGLTLTDGSANVGGGRP